MSRNGPDVADPVAEHRDPLDTHPEREALVALRVDPAVLQDDRVDHAGAEDRHPAGSPAGRTADPAADQATDVEGHRRLRERVVAGPEAGRPAGPEHGVGELVEEAAQVAEVGPFVHHEPFDLEELRRVRRVDRLVAEAAPGQQGADRRALRLHDPDLARRRVRPQEAAVDVDVQRVPQVARRMVGRDVEHPEVRGVALDLRPLVRHEPELAEDLRDPADRLLDGMQTAARDRPAGRRDVDGLRGQPGRESGLGRALPCVREGRLDRLANLVHDRPHARPIVGGQLPDPAHQACQGAALATEIGDVELLERRDVGRGGDPRQRLLAERAELAGERGEVHER